MTWLNTCSALKESRMRMSPPPSTCHLACWSLSSAALLGSSGPAGINLPIISFWQSRDTDEVHIGWMPEAHAASLSISQMLT